MEKKLSQNPLDTDGMLLKEDKQSLLPRFARKEKRTAPAKRGHCKSWTFCLITIVCCWLIHCTLGFGSYSFGNITPYLTSYLRNVTGEENLNYADTLWIQLSLEISTNVLMWGSGLLFNHFHTKLCLLVGILFYAASMFGCYWAIQHSFPATVAVYGVLSGVTHSLMHPAAVNIAVRWVPEKLGLVAGIILMGYGCGPFAWNQLVTWFINPDNLQPDLRVGEDVYYTQDKVLQKVPQSFLLMGTVFAGVQLLALILICEAPPEALKPVVVTEIEKEPAREKEKLNSSLPIKKDLETSFNNTKKTYGSTSDSGIKERDKKPQYHPREVIKTRVFWTLWGIFALVQLGSSLVINLYKAYGQTFILDDHFLTLVASFSSLFNAGGRPFWGLIGDKIGYRLVSLLCLCIAAGLIATFVTTEETGRVAYFAWVCCMFLSMCGFFTMKAALMLALFGSKYFNSNLGLLLTNGVIGAVLTGLVAPALKAAFGWHGMFYFGFGGVFAGFLLNLSLDIRCGNSIPEHMYADLSLYKRV